MRAPYSELLHLLRERLTDLPFTKALSFPHCMTLGLAASWLRNKEDSELSPKPGDNDHGAQVLHTATTQMSCHPVDSHQGRALSTEKKHRLARFSNSCEVTQPVNLSVKSNSFSECLTTSCPMPQISSTSHHRQLTFLKQDASPRKTRCPPSYMHTPQADMCPRSPALAPLFPFK